MPVVRRRPLAVAALLALALALALAAPIAIGRAQDDPPAPSPFGRPLKLGAVDVGEIFRSYVVAKRFETRINEEKQALEKGIEAQRDRVIELRKDAELLTGDALEEAEMEIRIEVGRLRLMKQRAERTLKRRFETYGIEILGDIEEVVTAYGAKHRYTLILKVDTKRWGEDRLQAALQSVLYHGEQIDLTPTIVTILNSEDWLKERAAREKANPESD